MIHTDTRINHALHYSQVYLHIHMFVLMQGDEMQRPHDSELQVFHAQICQALADPTRILLLYHLADGPKTVGALAESLGISQPTVSRHLKVLRERGMVIATRYGATIECRLVDERPIQALDLLRSVMHDNLTRRAELISVIDIEDARGESPA